MIHHTARVISVTAEGPFVLCNGKELICATRGKLHYKQGKYKSPISVGDLVDISIDGERGCIEKIHPRYSELVRSDNLTRRKIQLIAANIDIVFITISIGAPNLKPALVDRYIIAARSGKMHPVILFNKVDLLEEFPAEKKLLDECIKILNVREIDHLCMSHETGLGFEKLKEMIKGKTSVFSGQSGVGKSSIINRLLNLRLKTGIITEKTRKGTHTTTQATLIPLENNAFCIDTPGIKSFGVWNLTQHQIDTHYVSISKLAKGCKFSDCRHDHEPECAVKIALDDGSLSPVEFDAYLSLRGELEDKHQNR